MLSDNCDIMSLPSFRDVHVFPVGTALFMEAVVLPSMSSGARRWPAEFYADTGSVLILQHAYLVTAGAWNGPDHTAELYLSDDVMYKEHAGSYRLEILDSATAHARRASRNSAGHSSHLALSEYIAGFLNRAPDSPQSLTRQPPATYLRTISLDNRRVIISMTHSNGSATGRCSGTHPLP
jgi:hypothetical protein